MIPTNRFLNLSGWALIALSLIPLGFLVVGLVVITYEYLTYGPAPLNLVPFGVLLPPCLAFLLLGRYARTLARNETIPDLDKEIKLCSTTSGVFGVGFATLALAWGIGNSQGGDPLYWPVLVAWSVSSVLLVGALFLLKKRTVFPAAARTMMIVGVLTLPIGVVPLLLGIRLRRLSAEKQDRDEDDS